MMKITEDIRYVGVDDHKIDLFEGQYVVKNGMSYNSYVILDDKIAVLDTVDEHFKDEWLSNIKAVLNGRDPDYLVVHHMEGDHSANIGAFMSEYPKTTIVSSLAAFNMIKCYFGSSYEDRRLVVKTGDTLNLGKHTLRFVETPMVHWPEVIMSYDEKDKVLFSADAFGTFGANDVKTDNWDDEARRYYIGVVGKFGVQVQAALSKLTKLDVQIICSLHGPVLTSNLSHYLDLYNKWSKYESEDDGVLIAYRSIYGHTKKAALKLEKELKDRGVKNVDIRDVPRSDMYECVALAFKHKKLVIATTSYNADIFPCMKHFIDHLIARGYKNRTICIIESGSWAPIVNNSVKKKFENSKDITFLDKGVKILCALNEKNEDEIKELASLL